MAVVEVASRYRWAILGLVVLIQFCGTMSALALAPLAPLFQPELGLTRTQVGVFTSTAFGATVAVLLLGGALTDRFGTRTMVSLGLPAIGVLLLSISQATTFPQAVAVMLLVGAFRAIVFPGSTKAIAEWFPPSGRATAMGVKQTGGPLSGMFAATTLPGLALVIGWRTALAAVGLFIILFGVVFASLYRNPDTGEKRPMPAKSVRADLAQVFRNRRVWSVSCMAFLFGAGQQTVTVYLALYLTEVLLVPVIPDQAVRIVAAGGYLALYQAGGVFGRVFWGVVADRLFRGRRLLAMSTVGVLSALATGALAALNSGHPLWLLTGVAFFAGVNLIGWNGVYHTLITDTVGAQRAGTGVGLGLTISELGVVLGPPLFGFSVDLTNSYPMGWLLMGGVALLGALVPLLEHQRGKSGTAREASGALLEAESLAAKCLR